LSDYRCSLNKLKGEIEETQDQLGEVEKTVDELKTELEDDISQNNLLYLLLTAGLVYSLFELAIGLPSLVTIGVGVSLIVSILYVYLVR